MVEDKLIEMGLKPANDISEIVNSNSFIVNSKGNQNKIRIYPIIEGRTKLNNTNLVNLYGTHWSYEVDMDELNKLIFIDGDSQEILRSMKKGIQIAHRHAFYAFTKNSLEKIGGLWLFKEETKGWDYFTQIVKPLFEADLAAYKEKKRGF